MIGFIRQVRKCPPEPVCAQIDQGEPCAALLKGVGHRLAQIAGSAGHNHHLVRKIVYHIGPPSSVIQYPVQRQFCLRVNPCFADFVGISIVFEKLQKYHTFECLSDQFSTLLPPQPAILCWRRAIL